MTRQDYELAGTGGTVVVRRWEPDEPRLIAVIAHGYGEHSGRYDHVARCLADAGAVVHAPDHRGHGRSAGEAALVTDLDDLVADVHSVVLGAAERNPGLPVLLVGHSMGGMIATRYAQLHPDALRALVLSGPVIGGNPALKALLGMDPIPEIPIDPEMLSRDPAVGDAYAEDPLVWHGAFKRPTLEALFASVDTIAAGPNLETLPVLWLHGEQDPLAPLGPTTEAVERTCGTNVERRIYPGARHEVFNEINSDDVLGEVLRFVDSAVLAGARPA